MATQITTIEIDGRIQALSNQRDNANNEVVTLSGKMALLEATIKHYQKTVDDLKKQIVEEEIKRNKEIKEKQVTAAKSRQAQRKKALEARAAKTK